MVEFSFYVGLESERPNKFVVSAFDWRDIDVVNQHIQAKILRAARHCIDSDTPQDEKCLVMDSAMRVASELSVLSADKAFATVEAHAFMLYTSLRKVDEQKHITYSECLSILRDDRNFDEYMVAVQVIKGQLTKRIEVNQDKLNPTQVPEGLEPVTV